MVGSGGTVTSGEVVIVTLEPSGTRVPTIGATVVTNAFASLAARSRTEVSPTAASAAAYWVPVMVAKSGTATMSGPGVGGGGGGGLGEGGTKTVHLGLEHHGGHGAWVPWR